MMTKTNVVVRVLLTRTKTIPKNIVLLTLIHLKRLVTAESFVTVAMKVLDYTGCNRRNGPDFGRVFLRSNYTDITQNTYIQS